MTIPILEKVGEKIGTPVIFKFPELSETLLVIVAISHVSLLTYKALPKSGATTTGTPA